MTTTYDSSRYSLTDTGREFILRSKLSPVAIVFSSRHELNIVASMLVCGLSTSGRCEFLRESFSAMELQEALGEQQSISGDIIIDSDNIRAD